MQLLDGRLGRDASGEQQIDGPGDRFLVLFLRWHGLYQARQRIPHAGQVLRDRAIQRAQRGDGIAQAHAARVVPAGQAHVVDVVGVRFQGRVVDDQEHAALIKGSALPAAERLANLYLVKS